MNNQDGPAPRPVEGDKAGTDVNAQFPDWRDMSTAPKDGTRVYLWLADEGFEVPAIWKQVPGEDWSAWWFTEWDVYDPGAPDGLHIITHWMRPPPPPSTLHHHVTDDGDITLSSLPFHGETK